MVEDKGKITAKIPLFKDWLADKGISELLADRNEMDYMAARLKQEERLRVTDKEILKTREHLGHYRGRTIEAAAVRTWLEQFETLEDQRLMNTLLTGVRMYHENTVRIKMREAFGIVTRNLRTIVRPGERVRRDIVVSHLDNSEGKSGPMYCRMFGDENGMSSGSFLTLESFKRKLDKEHRFQRLVLIDDFSGTGQTLVEGLKQALETLRAANSQGIRIIVTVIVGFPEAREKIQRFIEENNVEADVHFCDELGDEDRFFSPTSCTFPDPFQRARAQEIAETKGVRLEPRIPLGYGGMEAPVVFYQSCPNNSLPILWSRRNGWFPLFTRF